jgi:hypothetical protein
MKEYPDQVLFGSKTNGELDGETNREWQFVRRVVTRLSNVFDAVRRFVWTTFHRLLVVRFIWLMQTTASLKSALLDSTRSFSSSKPQVPQFLRIQCFARFWCENRKNREQVNLCTFDDKPSNEKAGVLSAFMDHWNERQTDRLKRVDPVPDSSYERPAAALAAASQMMGTTVEQTFAALRQESEELQRLQVYTQSIPLHTMHACGQGSLTPARAAPHVLCAPCAWRCYRRRRQ